MQRSAGPELAPNDFVKSMLGSIAGASVASGSAGAGGSPSDPGSSAPGPAIAGPPAILNLAPMSSCPPGSAQCQGGAVVHCDAQGVPQPEELCAFTCGMERALGSASPQPTDAPVTCVKSVATPVNGRI
jgi:hypothetical protein